MINKAGPAENENGNGTHDAQTALVVTERSDANPFAVADEESSERWSPSGVWWRDFLYFAGPGWFVSIAYVDPGNYQADIQAGATSRYDLLFAVWWTSVLSMYVQVLCVRLSHYGGMNLAEAQAKVAPNQVMLWLNWFIAEASTILTDLPEVIGFGIAVRTIVGWPYYVGVLLSLITTMLFLATMRFGIRTLETIICMFVGIMAVAMWTEMAVVGVHGRELLKGWAVGFMELKDNSQLFALTGILGSVVMPHNLYLHTAACQSRTVQPRHRHLAVRYGSLEPVLPIVISFFVNMAVVSVAAESVYGSPGAENVGLTDFCNYFVNLANVGCGLWAVALMASGQSSAITTTYTGQYVMDGFLNLRLPVRWRAIVTRLVAIFPCVVVSLAFPDRLNQMVNTVNSCLSFLLPFAFSPLVRFVCDPIIMGGSDKAATGCESIVLHLFAFTVWGINAFALSVNGGGFFGDLRANTKDRGTRVAIGIIEALVQVFYAWWNFDCLSRSKYLSSSRRMPSPSDDTENPTASNDLFGTIDQDNGIQTNGNEQKANADAVDKEIL